MKKLFAYLGMSVVLIAFALTGCTPSEDDKTPPGGNPVVTVTAKQSSVTIADTEVSGYDYTPYFSITRDGEEVEVLQSYIDSSSVSETAGTYPVKCTYESQSAQISVTVTSEEQNTDTETQYELTLSVESGEITVKQSQWNTYDYKSLFKAYTDGVQTSITDDMIENNVQEQAGTYTYVVTFHNVVKTLTVHVVPEHDIQIVLTYSGIEIAVSDVADFDFTSLFALYVDGVAVQVTEDMIDASALEGAVAGASYVVELAYTVESVTETAETTVKVVEDSELIITAKNIETYPNSEIIDLTSLFEIKLGDKIIPVTIDMIEGTIDYSAEGENIITLTYNGIVKEATVTVKQGVVINYAHGDTVIVRRGTDRDTYDFASDFIVVINGIRFTAIPDSYFDVSEVDFTTDGTYTAKIIIKYNAEPQSGIRPPALIEVEKEINYTVVGVDYSVTVVSDPLVLTPDVTEYDPLKNIRLTLNGRMVSFTDNPEWHNGITACYAEVVKGVDFTDEGVQQVIVNLYVYGPDEDPVEVSYNVYIDQGVKITATNKAVFTGVTLYTTELFTVTRNGEEVEVTYDMLRGKVDTFHKGVYTVELEYLGVTAQAQVVVLDRAMIGTYITWLTTTPEEDDDYDDGEYGDDGWGEYYSLNAYNGIATVAEVSRLANLRILEDGTITFNGLTAYSVEGIDENTLRIQTGSNGSGRVYTLYYYDGIVIVDPDNTYRLGFSDYVRPIVYFQRDVWAIEEMVTVNYGSQHVLQMTTTGYSIDTFRIRDVSDDSEIWYALEINLLSKTSGDTIYEVTWGECYYSDNFTGEVGNSATLTFNGEEYPFTVQSAGVCKIDRASDDNPYRGMTFSGTIDGQPARIEVNSYGQISYRVNSQTILSTITINELSAMKNGGALPGDILFLYGSDKNSDNGIFSYKFQLDVANGTFTLFERDIYFGLYVCGNMYIFLDGYGTGLFNPSSGSHMTYQFRYSVHSGEIAIEFFNVLPTFAYGRQASFYIAPLLNVLTVKSFEGIDSAAEFENSVITDGAIVRVQTYRITGGTESLARPQLLNGITIITKDGELTGDAKSACIDTKAITWSRSGFYQFTITVPVNGTNVTSYYSVEVLGSLYDGNPVVNSFSSVSINGVSVSFDAFGRVTITNGNAVYSGNVTINADYSFTVKAYSTTDGSFVGAKGSYIVNGILHISFNGAMSVSDFFKTGAYNHRVAGGSGYTLREFAPAVGTSLTTVYVLTTANGEPQIVTLEAVEGTTNTFTVKNSGGEVIATFQIIWGNTSSGLVIATA